MLVILHVARLGRSRAVVGRRTADGTVVTGSYAAPDGFTGNLLYMRGT